MAPGNGTEKVCHCTGPLLFLGLFWDCWWAQQLMSPFWEDLRGGTALHGEQEGTQHTLPPAPSSCRPQAEFGLDTQNINVPLTHEHLPLMLAPISSAFQRSFPVGHVLIHNPGKKWDYSHFTPPNQTQQAAWRGKQTPPSIFINRVSI